MKDNSLTFDGVTETGQTGSNNGKWAGNQHETKMRENYGLPSQARKGAQFGKEAGPSTAKGGKINGGTTVKGFGNADKINVGKYITKGNPKE